MDGGLRRRVETIVGSIVELRRCSWDHGAALVWECRNGSGERFFVKAGMRARWWRQELHAYRSWAPLLGDRCASLVGAIDRPHPALVLTAVPGDLVLDRQLDGEAELGVYRQAGSLLRSLHELPHVDGDPMPCSDALVARASGWAGRAVATVGDEALRWMVARVEAVAPHLRDLRRVPCHRDFTPRNWLLGDDGIVRLIDFGHARPDAWLVDVERLHTGELVERPGRAAPFWAGYGRSLQEVERDIVAALSALAAVATISWAVDHRDPDVERHGRATLARLRGDTQEGA